MNFVIYLMPSAVGYKHITCFGWSKNGWESKQDRSETANH